MPNQRKQGKKKIGAWVDDADIAATYPFCSTMIDQLATTEHTPWTVDEWAARWRQEADARNALFQEHQQLKREIAHANREAAPFQLEITTDAPAAFHAASCSGSLDLRLGDCMDVMATFPDGYFDLAIVDPPYGLGKRLHSGGRDAKEGRISASQYKGKEWDVPPGAEYFAELLRVSKHQIIWGGNYFDLPPTRGILIWDKVQPMPTMSFGEMAWTSYDKPMKKIEFAYTNYVEGKGPVSKKIHPTQKPVGLYQRVLAEYTKPGMRVLDTHLGSGSIAIAAHYAGIHLTACEIDADYFHAAKARIARETSQAELFSPQND